eukprot:sb/3476433/
MKTCIKVQSENLLIAIRYYSTVLSLLLFRDEVQEIAKGGVLIGSSKSCKNEMVLVRNNIISMQSHPDLSPELMMDKIWPALLNKGAVSEAKREFYEAEMTNLHTVPCLQLIREFLKH